MFGRKVSDNLFPKVQNLGEGGAIAPSYMPPPGPLPRRHCQSQYQLVDDSIC